MASIFLSPTSLAIFSSSVDLFTMNGISVTTMRGRLPLRISEVADASWVMAPRPSSNASRIPSVRMMRAPVGKSGAGMTAMTSSSVASGSSMSSSAASMHSPRLCGAMLVAMPTAMPVPPLTSRLGKRLGRTVGSVS